MKQACMRCCHIEHAIWMTNLFKAIQKYVLALMQRNFQNRSFNSVPHLYATFECASIAKPPKHRVHHSDDDKRSFKAICQKILIDVSSKI